MNIDIGDKKPKSFYNRIVNISSHEDCIFIENFDSMYTVIILSTS